MVARDGPIRAANQDSAAARRARAMDGPSPSNQRHADFQYGPDLASKGEATAPTRCLRPAVPLAERYCHVLESVVFHFAQVSDAGL